MKAVKIRKTAKMSLKAYYAFKFFHIGIKSRKYFSYKLLGFPIRMRFKTWRYDFKY